MMRAMITRYAPAPTGFLHLGHVVNAVYVWGVARLHGGRVLLRIEDHDRQRSRAAYASAILEDLAWLGFTADAPPVRQSERGDIYTRALDDLRARDLVYACHCSRAQITAALKGCATATPDEPTPAPDVTSEAQPLTDVDAVTSEAQPLTDADAVTSEAQPLRAADAATSVAQPLRAADAATSVAQPLRAADAVISVAQPVRAADSATSVAQPLRAAGSVTSVAQPFRAADADVRYPGTCRDRHLSEAPGIGLRVRLEPSVETFVDLRHGRQEQQPSAQCGDLLLRDRDGNWTYQFAAVVDDWQQGVTLVVRGDDLLESTGRQIQLARLLGRGEPPRFLHHALVMKSAAQKLSKSDGDTGVRDLRARGWRAETVIGHAAALAGLVPAGRDVHAAEVSSIMSSFNEVTL
jgi:glutamyl/glutaminyl-tRNA synthetase